MGNIDWLSACLATVTAFVIGGAWYGPLFGRSWMAVWGFSEGDLRRRSVGKTFGLSLGLVFIAALNLELFIGAEATVAFGTMAGFVAGLGWVSTFLGILYLFEMRPLKGYLINAGYCTVALTSMGAVLGAM
ncbi:MAG: DUF1761 domain-containing protein [Nannocystaceae bacterium]